MEDLEKLQEMAKNGEISKKLLGDEDFKSKLKEVLKEEKGIDIKDEQIPEIIKNFEAALQDDKLLEEAELETVSGGVVKVMSDEQYEHYKNKHKRIRNAVGAAGMILGTLCTLPITMRTSDESVDKMKGALKGGQYGDFAKETGYYASHLATSFAAGAGMATLGMRLGDLIADKLIERDLKKDGVIKSNR